MLYKYSPHCYITTAMSDILSTAFIYTVYSVYKCRSLANDGSLCWLWPGGRLKLSAESMPADVLGPAQITVIHVCTRTLPKCASEVDNSPPPSLFQSPLEILTIPHPQFFFPINWFIHSWLGSDTLKHNVQNSLQNPWLYGPVLWLFFPALICLVL